ncbi:carboxysome shell carbonic anhydrase [Sulfurivirga caldicuralii]|uniref:Carboxysome shell carbonic anhydrase n=1 Tax=Sulfurivirga caldicuralii TaxID=364032 RepID=A0A1N6DJX3_9GAMM|nr:carboxysome shell carbonic anhydrase [Sulfurivirga caldicuralii]SIN71131.1 carboxysome shell carbonic anhydrase [Sulfurivirga caldicuralii]
MSVISRRVGKRSRRPLIWQSARNDSAAFATVAETPAATPLRRDVSGRGVNAGAQKPSIRPGVTHPLADAAQNAKLHQYECSVKARFDLLRDAARQFVEQHDIERMRTDALNDAYFRIAQVNLSDRAWDGLKCAPQSLRAQLLYVESTFAEYIRTANDFYINDPLHGRSEARAFRQRLLDLGIHGIDMAPCADGRLAHVVSYVLRLPWSVVRRKAHAGAMFDVSESVRNWVFTEYTRFAFNQPNPVNADSRYLTIAVYHYSKTDPGHLGCAAHGSDEHKAAQAALQKLQDYRTAIENRFGCGAAVRTLLLGLNTDDDTLRVHVPDETGQLDLDRYVDTGALYAATQGMSAEAAAERIEIEIDSACIRDRAVPPAPEVRALLAMLIRNNFSQIAYVQDYEGGQYTDLDHAERFIGIGDVLEDVQLRNLCYYSYMHTIEEGADDIDVGIKIFKKLNVKQGLPIPVIIRCTYDGRVPESRDRAIARANRLENALIARYKPLVDGLMLFTLKTLRDHTQCHPPEVVGAEQEHLACYFRSAKE